jgi:Transposase DDE domain
MRTWPKLTLVCHTATHLVASATLTRGPSQDAPLLPDALEPAVRHLDVDRLLGDGGYDSEANHLLAREHLGVRSTVIALNRRGKGPGRRPASRKWAQTRYRRQMYRRFHRRKYRQRWQAESVISRLKRRLGPCLRGRTDASKERECHVRILTHNLMILAGSSP